jgi:hypothetical protein
MILLTVLWWGVKWLTTLPYELNAKAARRYPAD